MAVNFPIPALFVAIFTPTFILWLLMRRYPCRPIELSIMTVIGAAIRMFSVAPHAVGLVSRTVRPALGPHGLLSEWIAIPLCAIVTALGALLFGGAALLNYRYWSQATPTDDRLDQQREINRLLRH
jgi:hypothetical protein